MDWTEEDFQKAIKEAEVDSTGSSVDAEARVLAVEALGGDWTREETLHALGRAETGHFYDPKHRERLCLALMRACYQLRLKAVETPALWCAMRRFTSFMPGDRAHWLCDFLQPEKAPSTTICALQCMTNLAYSALEQKSAEGLERTLDVLIWKYTSQEADDDADVRPLVIGACAAAAKAMLFPKKAREVAVLIRDTKRRSVIRLVETKWRERLEGRTDCAHLQEALDILNGEESAAKDGVGKDSDGKDAVGKPLFPHECPACVFHGTVEAEGEMRDIYVCKGMAVVGRYGPEEKYGQYSFQWASENAEKLPWLAAAMRLIRPRTQSVAGEE